VRSPWNQGLVGRVTIATRRDWRQGRASCRGQACAAPAPCRAGTPRDFLEDVAAALIEQKERFAQLIVAEAGKPVRMARTEVNRAVLTFRPRTEEACGWGRREPSSGPNGRQRRPLGAGAALPVGPVLAITPFNFPLNLGGAQAGARMPSAVR